MLGNFFKLEAQEKTDVGERPNGRRHHFREPLLPLVYHADFLHTFQRGIDAE